MATIVERIAKTNTADGKTIKQHFYWCPGCDALHGIAIRPDVFSNGAGWSFDGNYEKPTYHPSQLTRYHRGQEPNRREFICHTFITAGRIQFLGDSTHDLAGHTVDLPPLPAWVLDERDDQP